MTIVLGVFVLVVIGLALSIYQAATIAPLTVQVSALEPGETRIERERELLQLQSDNLSKICTIVAQVFAGVVLAVGAVATWRNLRVAQDNLKVTQDRLDVDREAQITNRFTQAIGQLPVAQSTDSRIAADDPWTPAGRIVTISSWDQ